MSGWRSMGLCSRLRSRSQASARQRRGRNLSADRLQARARMQAWSVGAHRTRGHGRRPQRRAQWRHRAGRGDVGRGGLEQARGRIRRRSEVGPGIDPGGGRGEAGVGGRRGAAAAGSCGSAAAGAGARSAMVRAMNSSTSLCRQVWPQRCLVPGRRRLREFQPATRNSPAARRR